MKSGDQSQKHKHTIISNTIYAFRYAASISKLYLLGTALISIFSAALVLINLFLIQYVLSALSFQNSSLEEILAAVIRVFLISMFLQALKSFFSSIVTPLVLEKLRKQINLDLFQKTLSYSMLDIDSEEFYNDYFFVINNAENSILSTIQLFGDFTSALISAVGLIVYLVRVDFLILLVIIAGIAGTCILSAITKKIRYQWEVESIIERRRMKYLNRIFYLRDYAKEVRSYASSGLYEKKYDVAYQEAQRITYKHGKPLFFSIFSMHFIQTCASTIIIVILVVRVVHKQIAVSDFVVLLNGAQQLNAQLSGIINLLPTFYDNSLRIEKTRLFFENSSKHTLKTQTCKPKEIRVVECRNVSFCYANEGFFLSNINLKLEKGKKIAIVGSNGAGKTTLAKIICGLYPSPENAIIVNDSIPMESIMESTLHQRIGAVFQDYQLFAFSIAENILMRSFGEQNDERIVDEALKFVGLYDKVHMHPKGIHAVLTKEFSSDGMLLSGGELQRLALARVYAHDFDVIIFDELTSSFDPVFEDRIYKMLDKVSADKAVLYISHRLLNMQNMDEIIYMEKGRIVERGTHTDLMKQADGRYFRMYQAQAQKYSTENV